MKSIKTRILTFTVTVLAVALIFTTVAAGYLNYSSTINTLKQTMSETVEVAASRVKAEISTYKRLIEEIAREIQRADSIHQQELDYLAADNGFTSLSITDRNGVALSDGSNISDRDYFEACRSLSKTIVSDPVIRRDNGDMNIMIVTPLMTDNEFDGVVFAGIDAGFLCDIVASISIGESGNAAILDSKGTTIGFADKQLVLDAYNTQEEAKSDPKLKRLAAIEADMASGNSDFGSYSYGGVEKFMFYTPIEDTNGWSIDVAVEQGEFLNDTYNGIWFLAIVSILILGISIVLIMRMTTNIVNPIKACVERIRLMAKGDLHSPAIEVAAKDETKVLADSTKELISELGGVIKDISYILDEMSHGNMDLDSNKAYMGDFVPIQKAIMSIVKSLNHTLLEINQASDQVAAGSEQVSAGAQALAQGATEQASSVEELAATIESISTQVKKNADNAVAANEKAGTVGVEMQNSNEKMQEMIEAITEISESSKEIGKIIKTIEDIAFQTNILALNASVEAARAGEAGKGFAVVAGEVGSLAGKSAEASKNTSVLIENSIRAVEKGTRIANETASSLLTAVNGVEDVVGTIEKISSASQEQASSIVQVTQGMDQISSVVQTNSATAEESAATSQELSGQAQILKGLIGQFTLREEEKQPEAFAGGRQVEAANSQPYIRLGDSKY